MSEETLLVLKDLSMRLPYGVIINIKLCEGHYIKRRLTCLNFDCSEVNNLFKVEKVKPYLRPLAKMTDEERVWFRKDGGVMSYNPENCTWAISALAPEAFYWLLANMFDINGLIPKGLAIDMTDYNDLRNF